MIAGIPTSSGLALTADTVDRKETSDYISSRPHVSASIGSAANKGLDQHRTRREYYVGRYEVKYVIPRWLVPKIREYIRPFCELDPYCSGDPPEYVITTLQLDSPGLSLHYAKLWDFVNRFKLRVRTYGEPVGDFPVFMEIKAKFRATVVKFRSRVPFDKWGKHLFGDEILRGINFKDKKESENFYQFVRLVKEIGARPTMLIKYRRESYFGKNDRYSRITFDTRLQYQQTYSWDSWGRDKPWHNLDSPLTQTRRHDKEVSYSGVVMELKTLHDVPLWLVNLAMEFGLDRQGHCKYSNSVWAESLFSGTPWTPEYEVDLLSHL
jgi:VTC domain